jgi:hypothetical protein
LERGTITAWNGSQPGLTEFRRSSRTTWRSDDEQLAAFRRYAVEPYPASILRYGEIGSVVVGARKKDEIIDWEDFEEAATSRQWLPDGRVLEHWCNQEELNIGGKSIPLRQLNRRYVLRL